MRPLPTIEEKQPFAIHTFSLLEHGVYVSKRLDKLVMWSDAPESMIHGADFKKLDKAKEVLPKCVKELLGVPCNELDSNNVKSWLNYSLLKEPYVEGTSDMVVVGTDDLLTSVWLHIADSAILRFFLIWVGWVSWIYLVDLAVGSVWWIRVSLDNSDGDGGDGG